MDTEMKKLLLAFALCLVSAPAWAQCSGVFTNNTFCGNVTGSSTTPRATPLSSIPATTVANDTIMSNISGGVAAPSANTLSDILDAILGSSEGSVIYRSGAGWVALASSNGVLTNTANALSWSSAGSGTVTSITQGTGMVLTPSPITTTGSVAIDPSTAAGLAAGTANKVVTSDIAVSAPNFVPLTSAATVTPDLNTGYNFSLVQAHSFTLDNPTNTTGKEGRSFCIVITNAAVAESITFGSEYFAAGGTSSLALSETNGALDMVCGLIYTTSEIFVFLTKAFAH